MRKKFNVTGWCNPERHFMADISRKVKKTLEMVYDGDYFIINRPRQYGKTTMLEMLDNALRPNDEWLVFNISFEGIGSVVFQEEESFCHTFLRLLQGQMKAWGNDNIALFFKDSIEETNTFVELSDFITRLVQESNKKLILLIDEVDKSSNNQLFLDFLGVLRNKYLYRHRPFHRTFHSVILTGVNDIKTLKLKLRATEQGSQNSPWNIAADFKVEMSLQESEIIPMLKDFAEERGLELNPAEIAEKLYYYTAGYPFLVSALCKIIDEDILPEKQKNTVTTAEVIEATQMLLHSTNANFDSLKKNLQNNQELYNLVYDLMINGEPFPFNRHDPIIELGIMYGIFKSEKSIGLPLQIHNRIYAEIIYDFMSLKMLRSLRGNAYAVQETFTTEQKGLNFEKVLLKFQSFMKEEYNKKDRTFLEQQGRLIFLAYLKPILNGAGFAFKEPQISEEKRLDIVVSFYQHQYIVELKLWKGAAAHEKGLRQLADYMERQHQQVGYLLIFDHRLKKSWKQEWVKKNGKQIFVVWV